jgi:hypothetical protein
LRRIRYKTPILDQFKVKKMIFGELKTFQLSSNLTRWANYFTERSSNNEEQKMVSIFSSVVCIVFIAITSLPVTEITNLTVLSNSVCGFHGLKN